jgi:hypothetical protein
MLKAQLVKLFSPGRALDYKYVARCWPVLCAAADAITLTETRSHTLGLQIPAGSVQALHPLARLSATSKQQATEMAEKGLRQAVLTWNRSDSKRQKNTEHAGLG